jgi:hypothetical protein
MLHRFTFPAVALGLVACRGVLGIEDGPSVPALDDAAAGSDASVTTADGQVATTDAASSPHDGGTDVMTEGGCAVCADGGCLKDTDCLDPLSQKCANGSWGTDASYTCIARPIWGTLHADLPTGSVDYVDQYYGDVTTQTTSVLLRVQSDKGYVVWSVSVPNTAPVNSPISFSPKVTTNVFVTFTDNALGTSKGGWNGDGILTLTSMSTTPGEHIAGTFTGTLTQLGTNQTAAFHGQMDGIVP